MMEILAVFIMILSLIFMFFGVWGIFRFKDFYSRILITSKVETVGFITLMAGIIIHSGFTYFSLKVILISLVTIITNPIATHAIARSAFISGYKIKRES
ncbi:MAG: monovalent cation/H(+) antiporter subunit G [Eubacteriales bacterium]